MSSKMTPELREVTKKGNLVPDAWIGGVMKDAVLSLGHGNGEEEEEGGVAGDASPRLEPAYILDGYPRTEGQAMQCLDDWEERIRTQLAVFIDVPKEVVLAKLSGRLVCVECGRGYNDVAVDEGGFDMPAMLPSNGSRSRCECGGCLRRRDDDTDAGVVEERLRVYEKQTKPVIDLFAERGKLYTFTPYRGVADIEKMYKFE
jgi:adenylate kinase